MRKRDSMHPKFFIGYFRVMPGCKATFFEHKNYGGESFVMDRIRPETNKAYNSGDENLLGYDKGFWYHKISSIQCECNPPLDV